MFNKIRVWICDCFGHDWGSMRLVALDCHHGCYDRQWKCQRCQDLREEPGFRRWRCPVHEKQPGMLA